MLKIKNDKIKNSIIIKNDKIIILNQINKKNNIYDFYTISKIKETEIFKSIKNYLIKNNITAKKIINNEKIYNDIKKIIIDYSLKDY